MNVWRPSCGRKPSYDRRPIYDDPISKQRSKGRDPGLSHWRRKKRGTMMTGRMVTRG